MSAAPVRARDTAVARFRSSFAAKLLLALAGSIAVLLLATVAAIRVQTGRQVAVASERALAQSRKVFAQQESDLRNELQDDAVRLAGSNRLPAAVDEAISSGSTDFLVQTTTYEMSLARIPQALTAYTDPDGRPLVALDGGHALPDPATAVPAPLIAWLMRNDTAFGAFGYHQAGARLYAVYATRLVIFGHAVGMLVVGTPVSDAIATSVGSGVGAEVCFVAGGRCVARTPGVGRGGLQARMVAAAGASGRGERVKWNGHRYQLGADRIATGAGMRDAWRVTAIPLDGVVAPFESIQRVALLVGFGCLGLAVLLGIVLSRGFARPVRALVAATERVAEGDYDVRVEVERRDELGTLAHAFNEMTHGLMLKERYRGVLDKVVSREVADELLKGEITLGGETRRVATLFADVRGFTALTEGMEPQRVIALVNEVMERAAAAVEGEGGVVDKYVGDEVMAVFGAPASHGGDELRAVRAALRIRASIEELNRERTLRGEPVLGMGIGINAGLAVAGNMGSHGRLNYTVLGESVNVASRLCDVARGGEILVVEPFLRSLGDALDAVALGPRIFKGISRPLEVYAVRGVREPAAGAEERARTPAAPIRAASGAVVAGVIAALALGASPARAQNLPTFKDLGVSWTSKNGFWQVTPSGRIDLDGYFPGGAPAWLVPSTRPFVAGRASLFVDLFAGNRVYGLVEARADRGEAPADRPVQARIEQAYLRLTPVPTANFSIEAGKFVTPFGGWPQRHNSVADPFIRPPLPYDYRTMISPFIVPGSAAAFASWKENPGFWRPIGAPIVWEAPYQFGAMAMGGWKTLGFRVGWVNSAPSSEPSEWNPDFNQKHAYSFVAHAGWQVTPELKLGVSYDRGPYLQDSLKGAPLPADENHVSDFDQRLWGFEASFARGPVQARGELLLDQWDVPNIEDPYPSDVSFYAETRVKLTAGLFAAARYSGIRFSRVEVAEGQFERWDYPIDRVQLGAGYQLSRTTEVRAEYMINSTSAPPPENDNLLSLRWSWQF